MALRPTKQELLDACTYELQKRLGVTNFGDSSIAGAIAKVMATRQDEMWAQIEEIATQTNILTATGAGLDTLGEERGVFREEALPNHSFGTVGVTFTNLGTATTIPAGTSVWCSSRPNSKFTTLYSASVDTNKSVDVTIVSEGTGDYYNVLPGEIDRSDVSSDLVSVTNRYSIFNGSNGETDEEYRSRIIESYTSQIIGTADSIKSGLKNLPGIKNVILYPAKRGPGTLDILVIPRSEVTTDLLGYCNIVLEQRVAPGIDWRLLTPVSRVLDISLQALTTNNTSLSDYAITAIENTVRYYIESLDTSTVSLEALKASIYRVDSSITSINISMWLDGAQINTNSTIYLDEGELLTLGTLEVK